MYLKIIFNICNLNISKTLEVRTKTYVFERFLTQVWNILHTPVTIDSILNGGF